MSAPGQPAAPAQRPGPHPGLLAALMAAVRPEYRCEVLVFAPDDPVFGGPACRAAGCWRTARVTGMCAGHYERWIDGGRPDLAQFAASAGKPWHGHAPLASCRVAGCGSGAVCWRELCSRHRAAWRRAGQPDADRWARAAAPVTTAAGQVSCQISICQLWVHPGAALCYIHHRRWKNRGRPDLAAFVSGYENGPAAGRERADLTALSRQLRLEVQYALQCRGDEKMGKTRAVTIRSVTRWLAASGASSLLDHSEQAWQDSCPPGAASSHHAATLLIYAHRKVTTLAEGEGWDSEYPRDIWRLRRLGIHHPTATLQFGGISQPWLRELAKRWTRWRLSSGLVAGTCYKGVQAVTCFSVFLQAAGITEPGQIDRGVLERYLADLHHALAGRVIHRKHIGQLATFLRDIRHHQWDPSLPPTTMIFPEDYPRPGRPAAARPRRARHGPGRRPRQPRPLGQPGLPADHHDPGPLRAADFRRRPGCLSAAWPATATAHPTCGTGTGR